MVPDLLNLLEISGISLIISNLFSCGFGRFLRIDPWNNLGEVLSSSSNPTPFVLNVDYKFFYLTGNVISSSNIFIANDSAVVVWRLLKSFCKCMLTFNVWKSYFSSKVHGLVLYLVAACNVFINSASTRLLLLQSYVWGWNFLSVLLFDIVTMKGVLANCYLTS